MVTALRSIPGRSWEVGGCLFFGLLALVLALLAEQVGAARQLGSPLPDHYCDLDEGENPYYDCPREGQATYYCPNAPFAATCIFSPDDECSYDPEVLNWCGNEVGPGGVPTGDSCGFVYECLVVP